VPEALNQRKKGLLVFCLMHSASKKKESGARFIPDSLSNQKKEGISFLSLKQIIKTALTE